MDSGEEAEILSHLLAFVEQTTDFVGVSDPWGRILYLNEAAKKRLGVADVTDLTLADLFPLEAFGFYYEVVRPELLRAGAWTGEVLVNAAGSGAIPMYVSTIAKLGPGGETNGGVVYAHEVSRGDPSAVGSRDDTDEETGLLERLAFEDQARLLLAAAHRDGQACALVLADIRDADDMIEQLGVLVVANVMRALGGRMTRLARTVDVVGRLGPRQLGLLLYGVRSRVEALRIAGAVRESLVDRPITTAGGDVAIAMDCSVVFSEPGDDPAAMIDRAIATMTPIEIESVDLDPPDPGIRSVAPSLTIDDFYVAMSHGHVVPYAQPVVDIGSGLVIGYCGFARWHHRTRGTLEPSEFVELIAAGPLANELDLYITRETAAVLLLSTRERPLSLYSHVSRRLIADVRTEQYLSEIADAYFLAMEQMRLQVARPLLDHWTPALEDALRSLRDANVELVLTGIEQVADAEAAREHGFSELHISHGLADAAVGDPDAAHVVADIVRHAHDRGLLVAAVGVSNRRQADALAGLGCDRAMGDLFGEPEPATTIDAPEG